ncbi:MAG: imelysin family protein [Hyphomicrobium sp.]
MRVLALAFVGLFHAATPANAFDHAALAKRAYDNIIVPGYARFDDASRELVQKVEALCSAPSSQTLETARAAARNTLLAFGRIEPIRFGPITQKQRLDRLLFYPDPHGIVGKQTSGLMSKQDEASIDPEKLAAASVAVQGFGAVDAVLFGRGSEALTTADPKAAFRCRYARALALDISQIAHDTRAEWQGEYGKLWLHPGAQNATYLSDKETTAALFRAYVTHLDMMRLHRLAAITPGAKPTGPLLPNSRLALAFVMAGIEGERDLIGEHGFFAEDPASTEKEQSAVAMLGSVATDLGFAIRAGEAAAAMAPDAFADPAARERLTPMLLSLKNAEIVGRPALGELTGQTLGFNSLDGD